MTAPTKPVPAVGDTFHAVWWLCSDMMGAVLDAPDNADVIAQAFPGSTVRVTLTVTEVGP